MKQKIMIIEDNMITARQISAFLNNDGYETKVYLDGESALADFQEYAPHLVLMDYFLPGMNAPDVMYQPSQTCHDTRDCLICQYQNAG